MDVDKIAEEAAKKMIDPKLRIISESAYNLQLKAFTEIVKKACLQCNSEI